jgi:hypothetical protein
MMNCDHFHGISSLLVDMWMGVMQNRALSRRGRSDKIDINSVSMAKRNYALVIRTSIMYGGAWLDIWHVSRMRLHFAKLHENKESQRQFGVTK